MIEKIHNALGASPSRFQPDGTFYRFGKDKQCWALGFEAVHKSARRWVVICGNWADPSKEKMYLYSDHELEAAIQSPRGNAFKLMLNEFKVKFELEQKRNYEKKFKEYMDEYQQSI